ncbi:uncharacterized protein LOC123317181 isoform X2 [Coccinella septempunctata]|uniref:uncharacterized protein LOC123317181 isoform X2 n=1 Tax=Coccinella septempunctata TaxID=41139 RepID=UPI001D06DD15|nr:uncharacterized protein LOC123317181 isoform X2 [Coccinella septempunctata]
MNPASFCVLVICLLSAARSADKKPEPSELDRLRYELLELEETMWRHTNDLVDNGVKENENAQVRLIKMFERFGDKISERLPADVKIPELENVWSWEVVYSDLKGVYVLYETFRRFQRQQTAEGRIPSPKRAWSEMAETILYDAKSGVPASMDRIHDMVLNRGLFDAAAREATEIICGNQQPPQQILYNLFSTIAVTEIKGYSMIQFSYMLLKLYGKGNFTKESAIAKMKFKERTNKTLDIAKNAMNRASREYWKCDPRKYVKGETYEELTELLQGYIINEVDMNSDNTCRENCGEYQYAKMYGCFKNLFCRQQRPCKGKILNCKYVDADMEVCMAEDKTNRRYESIEYENGLVYGRRQACRKGATKVDSWWRWLFWHCSYCMCVCDEQGRSSDRYFNMRPTLADVDQNKVVTGLRFVKKNRIIHLQIQQGTLEEFGTINSNSLTWKEVDNYTISDRSVYSGKDYHIMTWEQRALDLDDLEADRNHVLTGVKFKKIGSHLNFEIHTTPFNYTTGKLDPSKSVWKDNPNTDASQKKPRSKVMMYNPDVPTRTPSPSIKLSRTDQFIEFTHTDFERDAAQTTVPFLDSQPVSLMKPVALAGAGLFYKGRINFGGFVTPKIIAYDYSEHLEPIFPEPAPIDSDELVPMISVETLDTPVPAEMNKYQ